MKWKIVNNVTERKGPIAINEFMFGHRDNDKAIINSSWNTEKYCLRSQSGKKGQIWKLEFILWHQFLKYMLLCQQENVLISKIMYIYDRTLDQI